MPVAVICCRSLMAARKLGFSRRKCPNTRQLVSTSKLAWPRRSSSRSSDRASFIISISVSPAGSIMASISGDRKKLEVGVDIPTSGEIKSIIAAAMGHSRPFLLTAIFTGLRSSELRGLRWSDVDLKQGRLEVRQRADRYGKIGSPKSALREWKLQCPKGTGLVFPAVSGDAVALHNNTVRAFTVAVRAAVIINNNGGPKYTGLHALRHFFASWCINPKKRGGLGLAPKEVQTLLGHSSLAMTTDTYGHLFPANDDVHERLAESAGALLDAT